MGIIIGVQALIILALAVLLKRAVDRINQDYEAITELFALLQRQEELIVELTDKLQKAKDGNSL